jgi:uncharacterized membrane protein YjjP (DUF1212 family)
MSAVADPVVLRHRDLEKIANAALKVGRILMECGARVNVVREGMRLVAQGLGANVVGERVGYASLTLTVGSGDETITRMIDVGAHGVNYRLDVAVRRYATKVAREGGAPQEVHETIDRLVRETRRHPLWLVAPATGLACAAFGRLLGVDWPAFLPILLAGGVGQWLRAGLHARRTNPCLVAVAVAFVAGGIGGFGARAAGSASAELALIASTLLLVPGVPATNAQTDIMEGFPTVGSARAVSVAMIMVFATIGIWGAEAMLGMLP